MRKSQATHYNLQNLLRTKKINLSPFLEVSDFSALLGVRSRVLGLFNNTFY